MSEQIQVTTKLQEIADSVEGDGITLVIGLKDKVHESLETRPYNDETSVHEYSIRWRRTADQILDDGYVYQGKACTDIVIAFLGLAKARGYECLFVKVRGVNGLHSLAEIKADDDWYIFNVTMPDSQPQKGQFVEGIPYKGWVLLGKASDAWELGYKKFE